jgi:hypothetical protein
VLRQQRLSFLQKFRAGGHVEEVHRPKALSLPPDARLTLLRLKAALRSLKADLGVGGPEVW